MAPRKRDTSESIMFACFKTGVLMETAYWLFTFGSTIDISDPPLISITSTALDLSV